jgi:hypothetical protein
MDLLLVVVDQRLLLDVGFVVEVGRLPPVAIVE